LQVIKKVFAKEKSDTMTPTTELQTTNTGVLDTLAAIEARRSVKHFDATATMPDSDAKKLLELAMLSPTSFNIQNWRFVWVKDVEKRQAIRQASWNQSQVEEASMLVVLCADLTAANASSNPSRYWHLAPQGVQDMIVPMISQFYENNEQLQRDEALRSVGMAAQTLMLAAKALGYDSCPMIGFDANKVAEIIQLPPTHVIGMLLPVGKALKPANPRSGPISFEEAVVVDSF
jgi:nitroreductase